MILGAWVRGGTNMSACTGIVGPGGAILGTQVGGGTNASACTEIAMPGGMILGKEVGGGMVTCAYLGIAGPRSMIPGVDSMVGGGMFTVEGASGFVHFPNYSPLVYGSL
jgi:hypothetical protein